MNLIKKKKGCFIMGPISATVLVFGLLIGFLLGTSSDEDKQREQQKRAGSWQSEIIRGR